MSVINNPSKTEPLVTILIITWNRKDDVLETIQSINEQSYSNFEIVVVDNGSKDGTVEAITGKYPLVRCVSLEKNMGVSAGRNAGIAIALGEIIFFLDSDASPGKNTLENVVNRLKNEPNLGVLNCKIVNATTRKLDGGPGWVYSTKMVTKQDQEFYSYSFSEGGAAIRKHVLDKTGLFWDYLFFGCEGQELSLRILDAGYTILYYPTAVVYHRASPLARVNEMERDSHNLRNSLSLYLVRLPWWLFLLLAPLKLFAKIFKGVRRGYIRQILSALRDFIHQVPILMKQRAPIQNKTARVYLKMLREQGPLSWDFFTWLKVKT